MIDEEPKNALRRLREERGWTMEQLAKRAKVAVRTVYTAEHGRSCRWDTQRRLLKALGLQWEDRSRVFLDGPCRYAPKPKVTLDDVD